MTSGTKTQDDSLDEAAHPFHRRTVHASRAPRPKACGCGLPVAFDLDRHEFFCIGCGSSQLCTCGGAFLGRGGRPVNVA